MNLDEQIVSVISADNKILSTIKVDSDLFCYPLRKDLIHLLLRYQAAHARDKSGFTQKAKNRTEVAGTRKKAWAQKETGRARQGDMKSPHCYGGGVAFGIRPRAYSFTLPKKMRALALASLLSHKIRNNGLCVLGNNEFEKLSFSKTKDVNSVRAIFGNQKIVFLYDTIDSSQTRGCKLADFVYMLDVKAMNIKSFCECLIICKNQAVLNEMQNLLKTRLGGVYE